MEYSLLFELQSPPSAPLPVLCVAVALNAKGVQTDKEKMERKYSQRRTSRLICGITKKDGESIDHKVRENLFTKQ